MLSCNKIFIGDPKRISFVNATSDKCLNGYEDQEMNITCFVEDYVKTTSKVFMERLTDMMESETLSATRIDRSRKSDTGLIYSTYLTYRYLESLEFCLVIPE